MATIVQKLSAKSLGWDRSEIGVAIKDGKTLLGRIAGIVDGLKQSINSETQEVQSGLKGNFRGISTKADKDGVIIEVTSGVCYLPAGVQAMIEGSLAQAKEADHKATINFAIDLYAIPETNKAGYSFVADSLVEATETDPLASLLSQADGVKALPAPAKAKATKEKTDA